MHGTFLPTNALRPGALSQAGLRKIMDDHELYLSGRHGARADLRSIRLDGLSLADRDLSECDLSGASLVGADLSGANLSRASLYCADLRDCDLRYTRLAHADLRGASFKGANLSHAFMDFADLRAASMLHLGDEIRFQGNTHNESPFGAVDFSNSSLRNASFRNAKLDNADFTDALLDGAVFEGARLKNACFRGAVLSGVDIADLPRSALERCLPPPTPAARARAKGVMKALMAHHEWFVTGGRSGRPGNIEGEDLRPLGDTLRGLCLAGLVARNIIAISIDLSGCQLQAAKFDGADLRGADFTETDLSGASFKGTKLAHACFRDARIQDFFLCTGQVLRFQGAKSAQFRDARVHADSLKDEEQGLAA